jgi:hypothetical protein
MQLSVSPHRLELVLHASTSGPKKEPQHLPSNDGADERKQTLECEHRHELATNEVEGWSKIGLSPRTALAERAEGAARRRASKIRAGCALGLPHSLVSSRTVSKRGGQMIGEHKSAVSKRSRASKQNT